MAASSQLSNPKREWPSPPPDPTVEPQPSKNSNKISDTTDKIPDPPLIVQSLSQSTNQSITSPSLEDLFLSKSSHLTRQELLRRRLHHLKQLSRVYRDHYWALMEELRVQYREYYWKFGVSPYKDEEEREIGEREVNVEGSGETDNNNFNNVGGNNNNNNNNNSSNNVNSNGVAAKLGLGLGFGFGEGGFESKLGGNTRCAFVGCKLKAMALTNFCHLHILSDPQQKLYKACNYVIKSAQAGPIICGKPILGSVVPSLCNVHFQKAQKHVTRALKKAGLNVSSSSKLAPKFHVIVAEYVRQIQAKRRGAQRNSGDNIVTKKVLIGQPQDP